MQFYRTSSKKIKYITLFAISTGAFWISIQIRKTRDILNGAFDSYVIHLVEPQSNDRHVELLEIDSARWLKSCEKPESLFSKTWRSLKFMYARRLSNLTNIDNPMMRVRATKQLSRIKNLNHWQYLLLASTFDARTAVGLARTKGVDHRYFLDPPLQYVKYNHDMLVHVMKDFLIFLDDNSNHPCMGSFISRVFADVHDVGRVFENYYDHTDQLANIIKSSNDVLPLSLESILHHSGIECYARDIVEQNGLYLLREIYNRFNNIYEVNVAICTILANISVHYDLLDNIHQSGWIGILAKWLHGDDMRLSVTAARALANLDSDEKFNAKYAKGIYALYPTLRTDEQTKIDVVFVHGLLGGVFYTWRQRRQKDCALSIMETLTPDPEILPSSHTNSPVFREYMEAVEENERIEWEDIGSDFEIISYDIPTYANIEATGPFACTGYDKVCCDDESTTQCWPRDWLTKDCHNLRIIGINYDTSLSMWSSTCPEERPKTTLEDRSNELIYKLKMAGVGNRPIVWVTHSMGGLIVKSILCKASESCDNRNIGLYKNTKGIVFYSTPHRGSRIANLNQPTSLVVLPSVEVQELREESPHLKKMHQKFLKLVQNLPIKVVSFIETKSTVVTAMKFNFLMVEPRSGNPGVGEYYEIPQDHLGICKPANRESFLYQRVLHLIKGILEELK